MEPKYFEDLIEPIETFPLRNKQNRTYRYSNGGTVTFWDIERMTVSETGNHHMVNTDGVTHVMIEFSGFTVQAMEDD